jgi:hypothetical protein
MGRRGAPVPVGRPAVADVVSFEALTAAAAEARETHHETATLFCVCKWMPGPEVAREDVHQAMQDHQDAAVVAAVLRELADDAVAIADDADAKGHWHSRQTRPIDEYSDDDAAADALIEFAHRLRALIGESQR